MNSLIWDMTECTFEDDTHASRSTPPTTETESVSKSVSVRQVCEQRARAELKYFQLFPCDTGTLSGSQITF